MAYADHFKLADDLIAHLNPIVTGVADPFLQSRYTGFVAVACVTVYELAIKEILCDFGQTKHKVLGHFARSHFDRLNGRIRYSELHGNHVIRFGEKYPIRFKKAVEARDKKFLVSHKKSVLASYNNLITWRHQFAHEGQLPLTATYAEAIEAYELGKQVIECLANSMKR
jgi:hypothetical protein